MSPPDRITAALEIRGACRDCACRGEIAPMGGWDDDE